MLAVNVKKCAETEQQKEAVYLAIFTRAENYAAGVSFGPSFQQ